jgi:MoaA/NifB/PqqE/SkfB family radical SAM enzyme
MDRASHVKEIALVGGEPLLMKQNYELLKVLPLDCQISIITNLSYDLKNLPCLPDLMKRPADKILWTVSAENVQQQFEYVRQGAEWNQLEENIKFLCNHWRNNITLNMVYSMFNAIDLLEIIKTYKSLGIQKFNLLPIIGHNSINVSFMPLPIRLLAKKILDQVIDYHRDSLPAEDRDLYPIVGVESISRHLEQGSGQIIGLTDFQKQIKWYDQWSSVPFRDLWPNVIELIDQHLA